MLELVEYIQFIFPGKMDAFPKVLQITKNVRMIPEVAELEKQAHIKELCYLPSELCRNKIKKPPSFCMEP